MFMIQVEQNCEVRRKRKIMVQLNIYDFFGAEADPLFQRIIELHPGEKFSIHEGTIKREHLFELETEDLHEAATSPENIYQKVIHRLNAIREDEQKEHWR
jgi:hypothetical protein